MTIAATGASSILSFGQAGSAQRPGLRQEMRALFKDIQSGNLTAARSDFDALSQLMGGASAAASTQFSALLGQVGSALSSGDIAGAQSALSDYQTGSPAPSPAPGSTPAIVTTHDHSPSGAQDGVASLIQAIQTGDLSGAQQAYDTLTGGTSATDAAATAQGNGGSDVFAQLIASVGQSLANSNIAAAQQDLTRFAQTQGVGAVVDIAA